MNITSKKIIKFLYILLPFFIFITINLFIIGVYMIINTPEDNLQKSLIRILYIHVPSAYLSTGIYAFIAIANFIGYIWQYPLADITAKTSAPIGATFTLITLITGMFWGKPAWGTWWVWDARLTSLLILFIIYLIYIILWKVIEDQTKAAHLTTIISLLSIIMIPIIKFSVNWWNTLHQTSSLIKLDGPSIHHSILLILFVMFAAFTFLFFTLLFISIQTEIIKRRSKIIEIKLSQ